MSDFEKKEKLFPEVSFRLSVIDECGSTNEELWKMRGRQEFHGMALLAHKQTSGVGRRSRSWWSAEGNLAVSIGFRLTENNTSSVLLPFAAGIALYQLLQTMPLSQPVMLKWPNDVYIGGKKFAGLLCEAKSQGMITDLVLGIGANLYISPPEKETSVSAISLQELGVEISPEEFTQKFLKSFAKVLQIQEFSSFCKEWERAAQVPGISLILLEEKVEVEACALLSSGELEVVEKESGIVRRLSAEEVSLRFLFAPFQ